MFWLIPFATLSMSAADLKPRWRAYANVQLEVHGLPADRVLVVSDDSAQITDWVVIRSDGVHPIVSESTTAATLGRTPTVYGMKTADYKSWNAKATPRLAKQPSPAAGVKPPARRVDCATTVSLGRPGNRLDSHTQVLEVVKITDKSCVLKRIAETPSSPCSSGPAVTGAASLVLGVGLVLTARRRRDELD
jgi:hypothetical protein